MSIKHLLASALFCAALCSAPLQADEAFQMSSPAFKDGEVLSSSYGYTGVSNDKTECGGQNISPPLAWAKPPPGTLSFALAIVDADGQNGKGNVHWLAYNIPPAKASVAAGEGTASPAPFTSGKNEFGLLGFRGFCPPKGQSAHHYMMTVYALDLPPTLPAGLTRAELLAQIDGHVLRASSIVGRFSR